MIADVEPYPEYKASGAEWIGEVPEGWNVLAARRFCRVFAGATPSRDEPSYWDGGSVPWLASGDVNQRHIRSASQFITEAGFMASSTKWIRPGSLVLALAGQGKTKGKAALVDCLATCNQSLGVLEPSMAIANPGFLLYYLESRYRDIRGLVGDLRDGLNLEHLKEIPIPLPPLAEQAVIVRFLDHVDSRIQRFITAKERLIELLEEEKQAIIHRAVTRGLDPDVPLKPSGVDWLGDVPEHWQVLDMGRFIDLLPGFAFPSGGFSSGVDDTRLLRGVNVAPGEIHWHEVVHWPAERQDGLDRYRLEIGDLVLGLDRPVIGTGTRIARVTESDTPSLLLQRVARIRTLPGLLTEFAYLLLGGEVFRRYMAPIFTGISVPHLSPEQVKKFRIGLPSLGEQAKIVSHASKDAAGIDAAVTAARRHITLLREYRTRLISDVVTGKLDVREVAERLPGDLETGDPVLDEQPEEVAA